MITAETSIYYKINLYLFYNLKAYRPINITQRIEKNHFPNYNPLK